jgi:hypothetical protein
VPTYVRTPLPPTGFRAVDDLLTEEGSTAASQPGTYDKFVRPALRGVHAAIEAVRPQTEAEHTASLFGPAMLGARLTGANRLAGGLYGTSKAVAKELGLGALKDYAIKRGLDTALGSEAPELPEAPGMFKPQYTFPRAQK